MSLTDNFDRADGDPGANWTDAHGLGVSIVSNRLKGDASVDYEYAGTRYSGSAWANDHSSQVVIYTAGYCGPAVRMSAGPNWYVYFDDGSVQECIGGGTPVEIAVFGLIQGTETSKLVVTGTTLEGFRDSGGGMVSQGSVADASLASGVPGCMFVTTTSRVEEWEGTGESGGGSVNDARIVIRGAG